MTKLYATIKTRVFRKNDPMQVFAGLNIRKQISPDPRDEDLLSLRYFTSQRGTPRLLYPEKSLFNRQAGRSASSTLPSRSVGNVDGPQAAVKRDIAEYRAIRP